MDSQKLPDRAQPIACKSGIPRRVRWRRSQPATLRQPLQRRPQLALPAAGIIQHCQGNSYRQHRLCQQPPWQTAWCAPQPPLSFGSGKFTPTLEHRSAASADQPTSKAVIGANRVLPQRGQAMALQCKPWNPAWPFANELPMSRQTSDSIRASQAKLSPIGTMITELRRQDPTIQQEQHRYRAPRGFQGWANHLAWLLRSSSGRTVFGMDRSRHTPH